jgi:glutathione S-transferase
VRSPLLHQVEVASSAIASTLRAWRGTMVRYEREAPRGALELFDNEGCPFCRPVREALTELDLDVVIRPCPRGGRRHRRLARELSRQDRVPVLRDEGAGAVVSGRRSILDHLFSTYARRATPLRFRGGVTSSGAASGARRMRGYFVAPSREPAEPLELYAFESSPYSRLVRERLSELEIPYFLHNLGKEQRADIGAPGLRLTLRPYAPKPGGKRAALLERGGKVQVPYLVDPGAGTALYESRDILAYLDERYSA